MQFTPKLLVIACLSFFTFGLANAFSDTTLEAKASNAFNMAKQNPLTLQAFLYRMPKGGDIHNHILGAVYAESYIQQAAEDKLCVSLTSFALSPEQTSGGINFCPHHSVLASQALGAGQENIDVYNGMLRAFSLLNFVPGQESAHDHFFGVFNKISAAKKHYAVWVDEITSRAAAQNEQYLELLFSEKCEACDALAQKLQGQSATSLMQANSILKSWHFDKDILATQALVQNIEQDRRNIEKCGTPNAQPACQVTVRYLNEVLRGLPKEHVFARMAFVFQLLEAEAQSPHPLWVGLNLVMPEDHHYAMTDYTEHMQILQFLKSQLKNKDKVHISLHAGELAPGLVPPAGLKNHIRQAVEIGSAERIGHGVDVMHEENPESLLQKMAEKNILVEINLTSNAQILNVSGKDHPLLVYRKNNVPVTLTTDDEGIERTDLSREYKRAVESYDFNYKDLKSFARNSLTYSFLPGENLWKQHTAYEVKTPCANDHPQSEKLSSSCYAFLKSNEKAAQQWELEKRFWRFESKL